MLCMMQQKEAQNNQERYKMARVKAEYFNAKDKATGEVKEIQFIPPTPQGRYI